MSREDINYVGQLFKRNGKPMGRIKEINLT